MNHTETVKLCRMIASLCPSQKLDQYTPDAWALVLDDIPFDDAMIAMRTIYREQGDDQEWVRKIEADDIIREVRRVRALRVKRLGDVIPPPGLTQAQERVFILTERRRAGNGEQVVADHRGALTHDLPPLQLAGRRITDDLDPHQDQEQTA